MGVVTPAAVLADPPRPTDVAGGALRGLVEPMGARGTDIYVVTTAVPRGPRGLWRSLVEATADAPGPVGDDAAEEPATEAHLGYLASLV